MMRQIINMILGTKHSRKCALYIKILKQWYHLKTQTRTCNWGQKILKQWYQLKTQTQTRTCNWVQKILKQWYQLKTQTRTCNWGQKILKQPGTNSKPKLEHVSGYRSIFLKLKYTIIVFIITLRGQTGTMKNRAGKLCKKQSLACNSQLINHLNFPCTQSFRKHNLDQH